MGKHAIFIAAMAETGFHRCGTFFSKEGAVFVEDQFNDKEWDRIMNEPNLHKREPTEEELAAMQEPASEDDTVLLELIADAIRDLPPEAFNDKGVPDVNAIKKALPDVDKGLIKAAERDAGLKLLTDDGWTVPEKVALS